MQDYLGGLDGGDGLSARFKAYVLAELVDYHQDLISLCPRLWREPRDEVKRNHVPGVFTHYRMQRTGSGSGGVLITLVRGVGTDEGPYVPSQASPPPMSLYHLLCLLRTEMTGHRGRVVLSQEQRA